MQSCLISSSVFHKFWSCWMWVFLLFESLSTSFCTSSLPGPILCNKPYIVCKLSPISMFDKAFCIILSDLNNQYPITKWRLTKTNKVWNVFQLLFGKCNIPILAVVYFQRQPKEVQVWFLLYFLPQNRKTPLDVNLSRSSHVWDFQLGHSGWPIVSLSILLVHLKV